VRPNFSKKLVLVATPESERASDEWPVTCDCDARTQNHTSSFFIHTPRQRRAAGAESGIDEHLEGVLRRFVVSHMSVVACFRSVGNTH